MAKAKTKLSVEWAALEEGRVIIGIAATKKTPAHEIELELDSPEQAEELSEVLQQWIAANTEEDEEEA